MKPLNQIKSNQTLFIGRSAENEIELNQRNISKKHASLTIDNQNNYSIQDLQSRNGTFVNDIKITQKVIDLNDKIAFANNEFSDKQLLEIYQKAIDSKEIKNPLDFSFEFAELEKLYLKDLESKEKLRNRDKNISGWIVAFNTY